MSSSLELTEHIVAQYSAVRGQIIRWTQLKKANDGSSRVLTALICRDVESGEARQAYASRQGERRARRGEEARVQHLNLPPLQPLYFSPCLAPLSV